MITRRSFLAALGALPFVGRFVPREPDTITFIPGAPSVMFTEQSYTVYSLVDRDGICASFDFETGKWTIYRKPDTDFSNITSVISERTMSREEFNRHYPSVEYFVPRA